MRLLICLFLSTALFAEWPQFRGNPALTGALRMKATRRIPVSNGGIDCRWLHYQIR